MSKIDHHTPTGNRTPVRARRWLLGAGVVICALSWIALGTGIVLDVSTATMVVLATLAALSTEGLFWLAALVLGVRVFEARRMIGQRLRALISRSAASGPKSDPKA